MNGKMIKKLEGKAVRVIPVPLGIDVNGNERENDCNFFVRKAGRDGVTIEGLVYVLSLGPDYIREFRSDPSQKSSGFLILNGQVRFLGRKAEVEPLLYLSQRLQRHD
jgi:hypothetical protein